MNIFKVGSIITATLLLVGCGSSGNNDTVPSTSSTPANSEVSSVVKKIGKGYYVDSPVQGVDYQCGNQKGTTDENGTFTFENGKDCNLTLGGVKLRDINASLLEDNITILETNEKVAQLLQTLDSDGNASNGIKIVKGTDKVIEETLPSLDDLNQDILEAINNRLKAEYSEIYSGIVVDINQAIAHLNETKADLKERDIKTNLDIEDEDITNHQDGNFTDNFEDDYGIEEDSNNSITDIEDDLNETIHNNSPMDSNSAMENMINGNFQ